MAAHGIAEAGESAGARRPASRVRYSILGLSQFSAVVWGGRKGGLGALSGPYVEGPFLHPRGRELVKLGGGTSASSPWCKVSSAKNGDGQPIFVTRKRRIFNQSGYELG